MQPTNLLFILSDQHTRSGLGCYGGPGITPHLDALARRGTRFDAAYTNCPICVPERASLATGRYVHEIGFWDNGIPYDGSVPSWGHHLRGAGFTVDSIGKLHFRSSADDNGFSNEIEPLHVVDGIGDLLSCVRDDPPRRNARRGVLAAGPGDSTYLAYDVTQCRQRHRVAARPCRRARTVGAVPVLRVPASALHRAAAVVPALPRRRHPAAAAMAAGAVAAPPRHRPLPPLLPRG